MEKLFIDANTLLNDAFRLGNQVIQSGFAPSLLIALWRGGSPVGMAIQELLTWHGVEHDHYPLKTRHYAAIETRQREVEIEGLEYILGRISPHTRLLIVDDVFDTGLTLDGLVTRLLAQSRIAAENIRIATVWFKPDKNLTPRQPDFFLHRTDRWIVFPHEIAGLSRSEMARGKGELEALQEL